MATLYIKEVLNSNISNTPIVNGQILVVTDTNEFYYDNGNSVRNAISKAEVLLTENDRITLLDPEQDRLYIIKENQAIYRYINSIWIKTEKSEEIADLVTVYTELRIQTLKQKGKCVAPRTVASAVYTTDGDTLQQKLNTMSSIGMSSQYVTAKRDNQKLFEVPFPFEGYLLGGNHILIFNEGSLIPSNKWTINKNNQLELINGIDLGDQIQFMFIYNSKIPTANPTRIDGAYISDGTISSRKLSNVSSELDNLDHNTLATSNAVATLYTLINQKIDAISGSRLVHANSTGTAYQLLVSLNNYTLLDGNVIILRCHTALARNATVKINALPPIPIYTDDENRLPDNVVSENEVINLKYNAIDGRLYMYNGDVYRIKTYTDSYTVISEAEITIPVNIENFNPAIDVLRVYQNNVRLFKDKNYIQNKNKIYLLNYSASLDDVFYFEVDRVEKNYI